MDRNLEGEIEKILAIGGYVNFLRDLAMVLGVTDDDPRVIETIRRFQERPYCVLCKDILGQETMVDSTSTLEEAIKLATELTFKRKDTDADIFYYVVCGPGFEEGFEM